MTPAHKLPALAPFFARMNAMLVRRHFAGVHVRGLANLAAVDRSTPVLFFANHSTWWDGLMIYLLNEQRLRRDTYLMMEERQFVRYSFFRWIGAFSVRRNDARDGLAALAYAGSLLNAPNRAVWMFPQGVLRPNEIRPLRFESGLARIAHAAPAARLIPVAMRTEFYHEQRPDFFLDIGTPVDVPAAASVQDITALAAKALTAQLDALRADLIAGRVEGFHLLLRGKRSVNRAYDSARMIDG